MRKWLKRLLILLFILLLPLLLAGIYLYANRESLTKQALTSLKKETGALISIQSADFTIIPTFPDFAITLRSVVITDSNIAVHQSPLLELEMMQLKASLTSFLLGDMHIRSVRMQNGRFTMEQYDDSSSNFLFFNALSDQKKILEPSQESNELFQFKVKNLEWKNIAFDFNAPGKDKRIQIKLVDVSQQLSTSDSAILFTLKGDLLVGMLGFNLAKGAFLANSKLETDFVLQWLPGKKKLVWDGSTFKASNHPFRVDGNVVMSKPQVLLLKINTKGILQKDVLPLLTDRIADKIRLYETTGPLDAQAIISGPLYPGEDPAVWIGFEGINQKFTAHLMKETFDLEHLKGSFSNQIDKSAKPGDLNSALRVSHVEGKWHDWPFEVSGEITDFDTPFLNGAIHIPLDQKQMSSLCSTIPFNPIQSFGWLKAKYSGPIDDLVSAKKSFGISRWKGNALIQVKQGEWRGSELLFKDLELKCRIDGDTLQLQRFVGKLNDNAVSATGNIRGMVGHIGNPSLPVTVVMNAQSKYFNLNPLLSRKEEKKHSNSSSGPSVGQSNFDLHLGLQANKVRFRKLDCQDLSCQFDLKDNHLKLTNLNFKAGGGQINLNSSIADIGTRQKKLRSDLSVSRVDVKKLLKGMDQFGQTVLMPENIEGRLDLDGDVAFSLNHNFDVQPETMKGQLSFQLKKAKLIRFKPLMDLSSFVLPKESLQEVELATLGTTLHLNGKNLALDEMEIPTSLATFYLRGEYDFAQKLDMDVLVPIHTISRKNRNEIIKRGAKDKDRPAIPIHIYKKAGETKFELDMSRMRSRMWKRVKGWAG